MTLEGLHAFGIWAALIAYALLTALFVVTWARKLSGRTALIAAILTTLHFIARALLGLSFLTLSLETLALLAWIGFLANLMGMRPTWLRDPNLRVAALTLGAAAVLALISMSITWRITQLGLPEAGAWSPRFAVQILIDVAGLLFVEQLMRNVKAEERWRIRYLGIGLGTLFLFQLTLNASGLHGGGYNLTLLALEPSVFALVAPCLAIATLRSRSTPMQFSISRQVVFRVGTLVFAGTALLTLGAFGYLVEAFKGDWRLALTTLVTIAVLMGVAIVFGSSRVRAQGRQFIAEHLFRQKYDYRTEWLRVTRQLTEPSADYDLPQQVIRALSHVVMAEGGAVWVGVENGSLVPLGQLNTEWRRPLSPKTAEALAALFEEQEQALDVRKGATQARIPAEVLSDLAALPDLRFIVPLMTESRVVGVVGLKNPPAALSLTWEDYDMLRLIAREAAGIVALQTAERALADADRLHGFHQLSAFVLHDVKTIAAQLSLLLRNAEKHKQNPEFIEDMLKTLANAVQRVNRLLEQLREDRGTEMERLDLGELLQRALEPFRNRRPAPEVVVPPQAFEVRADAHRLTTAIGHLVQNAIDAAAARTDIPETERLVRVSLAQDGPWAALHIEDSGAGMDRAFIETRLFQPLTSTKGVAGMGLGAYQAKTYLRALGGDVSVTSEPGKGSHFVLRLPLEQCHA